MGHSLKASHEALERSNGNLGQAMILLSKGLTTSDLSSVEEEPATTLSDLLNEMESVQRQCYILLGEDNSKQAQSGVSKERSSLEALVGMGYGLDEAQIALQHGEGDLGKAVWRLIHEGKAEKDADADKAVSHPGTHEDAKRTTCSGSPLLVSPRNASHHKMVLGLQMMHRILTSVQDLALRKVLFGGIACPILLTSKACNDWACFVF